MAGYILLPVPACPNSDGVASWEVWGPDPESENPKAAPMLLPLAAL